MSVITKQKLAPDDSLPLGNQGANTLFRLSHIPQLIPSGMRTLCKVTIEKRAIQEGTRVISLTPATINHTPIVIVVAGACQKLESYFSIALPLARLGVRVMITGVPYQHHNSDKKLKWMAVKEQIASLRDMPRVISDVWGCTTQSPVIYVPHSHGEYLVRGAVAKGLRASAVVAIAPEPIFEVGATSLGIAARFPKSYIEANLHASFEPVYRNKRFIEFITGCTSQQVDELLKRKPFDHGSFRAYVRTVIPDLIQVIRARSLCKDWTNIRLSGDRMFSHSGTVLNAVLLRAKTEVVPSQGHLCQLEENTAPTAKKIAPLQVCEIILEKVVTLSQPAL